MIRGNHDYWWKSIFTVRNLLDKNFYALQNDHVTIGKHIFCGTRGWQVPEKKQTKENEKIFKRELLRLELSIQSAKKEQEKLNNGAKIICLVHFPPFNSSFQESEFTKLFNKYSVDAVVYGHLHGKFCRSKKLIKINNIPYYLTSCDQIDNKLIEIKV